MTALMAMSTAADMHTPAIESLMRATESSPTASAVDLDAGLLRVIGLDGASFRVTSAGSACTFHTDVQFAYFC